MVRVSQRRYFYNFTLPCRPTIQFPQGIVAAQEFVWQVKPDLIIETGIAHGGSVVYYASVGDCSFIGTGAVVLPRIRVGSNVIVGAGAVVTKDVESGKVVLGNPARVTRDNAQDD